MVTPVAAPVVLSVVDDENVLREIEVSPTAEIVAFGDLSIRPGRTIATIFEKDRQISIKRAAPTEGCSIEVVIYADLPKRSKITPRGVTLQSTVLA
jgi:hypothetical protein